MADGATAERDADRAVLTWLAMRSLHERRNGLYNEPTTRRLWSLLGLKRPVAASLWPFANAWAATRAVAALQLGAGGEDEDGDGGRRVAGSPTGPAPRAPNLGQGLDSRSPARASWRQVLDGHVEALAPYAGGSTGVLDPDDPRPLRLEAGTWRAPGVPGDAYYDDNAWIALDLFAEHALTGDARCLGLARRVLDFVLSGWDDDASLAHPGGIRWAEPAWSHSRNTCSNAPAAQAAALAHRHGGEAGRLEWAERIVSWVDATLRSASGLYYDRIDPDGTVQRDLWTYNQGTMIGAKVLLFEAAGEARWLDEAKATVAASVAWLEPWETLVRQPPPFLAIYLRNVLLLGRHADVSPALGQVVRFADWAWDNERAANGLFRRGELKLNRTAGMTSLYALLAGAEPAA